MTTSQRYLTVSPISPVMHQISGVVLRPTSRSRGRKNGHWTQYSISSTRSSTIGPKNCLKTYSYTCPQMALFHIYRPISLGTCMAIISWESSCFTVHLLWHWQRKASSTPTLGGIICLCATKQRKIFVGFKKPPLHNTTCLASYVCSGE